MSDATIVDQPFDDSVISHISEYMNSAQPESLVYIATAFTGDASVRTAVVDGFDGRAVDLRLTAAAGDRAIRVPWPAPITERFEIRSQFVLLLERALDQLSRD
jgi:hypothetical protein